MPPADGFARALPILLKAEGGYVNDPDDAGGETNLGVTKKVWQSWCASRRIAVKPIHELIGADVAALYETRYWKPARCGEMPWPLSLIHFDAAVNSGVTMATRLLQRAVGAADDGVLGPLTMARVAAAGPRQSYRYLLERVFFYRALARKNASQTKFLVGGWLGRLDALYQEVT